MALIIYNGSNSENNMNIKFEKCRHRSDNKEKYERRTCCKTIVGEGYICHKRNITNLVPSVCQNCNEFEERTT